MKKLILLSQIITLLWLIQLSTCIFAQSKNMSEKARLLKPLPGKSLVYLFQNGPYDGLQVHINSTDSVTLFTKQFCIYSFEPGKYIFNASAYNEDNLILDVKADKKYYISFGSKASSDQVASTILFGASNLSKGSPRVKLEVFDPEKGDKCIKKCNLLWMNTEAKKMVYAN